MSNHIELSGSPELVQTNLMDEVDSLLELAGSRGKPKVNDESLVIASGPLTPEHLSIAATHVASGDTIGSQAPTLKHLRHSHHRLAQLLAVGVDEGKAAQLCNYSVSRVSILKSSPAFQELLDYYAEQRDNEWTDFVSAAAGLSMDMLQELQRQLDEEPERFTPGTLMKAIELLADRTGHAPVSKSVTVNVSGEVGSRLEAARQRLKALGQEAVDVVAG